MPSRARAYILIAVLAATGLSCNSDPVGHSPVLRDASVLDAAEPGCGPNRLEAFEIVSALHVVAPEYPDPPPVGGDHDPCWADYGVYEESLAPGRWVHNLEHGAVVLLHACEDCASEVEALRAFADDHERIIVTPYPELPVPFAAVAWGHRLLMDCLSLDAVGRFYDEHFNRAPEDVRGGAPAGC